MNEFKIKNGLLVSGSITGVTESSSDNSAKMATTSWVRTYVGASSNGSLKTTQSFTATAAQTSFTITGGYGVGLIDVYVNGSYLNSDSYTASNGTTVVLTDAASLGDILDVIIYSPLSQGFVVTSDQITEGTTNKYYTDARARGAISLTTTGTSGAATYNSTTGVINIPQYQGGVTSFNTRTGAVTLSSSDISTALGYTAANGANYLALVGGTLTGDLTLSGVNPRLYFTDTDNNPDYFISNTDGTFTVYDVTNSVGRFKIFTTGHAEFTNNVTAASFIKTGGTSSQFLKADGSVDSTSYQAVLTNPVTGTGTTNYLPKFTAASVLGNSNIQDSGTLITLGYNTAIAGSNSKMIIGSSSISTNTTLQLQSNITGGTTSNGIVLNQVIQSDVVTRANLINAVGRTAASAFNLGTLVYFNASQGALGAGSTVTNQYGFSVESNLIGATNNYGFYGNIASGSGRWNLYMAGTANNYLNGALGIGRTSLSNQNLGIDRNMTGVTTFYSVYNTATVQSDVTSTAVYYQTAATTAAATFTLTNLYHYAASQTALGAGSAITTQTGFYVSSNLVGATTNYGFRGLIPSGTGDWNLYMDGGAANYLLGNLGIGTNGLAAKFDVFNNIAFSLASLVTAADSRVAIRLKGRDTATNTLAISSNGVLDYALQVVNSDGTASGNIQLNPYGGSVGIGVASVNTSAKVQIDSTTQGFLPPRMTSAQRTAISSPATGLVVYQTDGTEGLYIKTASAWKALAIV
jgi:hypothetical protein